MLINISNNMLSKKQIAATSNALSNNRYPYG